jgi:uncharacterized protein (TIGR00369 family)
MSEEKLIRLKQLPLHRFLDIHEINAHAGTAELTIIVKDNMVNMVNLLHGGIIYTLCDACAYAALTSKLDNDTEAVTHDIQVSVMRPAKLGEKVVFNAEVVKLGKRVCFMAVKAFVNDKLIATSTVTKSII